MQRIGAILLATVLAVGSIFGSTQAAADHADVIRVHVPIHQHGPGTLNLNKLVHRHRQLDLDGYRLHSVVISNGPFSHGHASLLVGRHQTGRAPLARHGQVIIPAPGHGYHDWRLWLGPGSQVRMVTLVLEPRRPRIASYRSVPYRPKRLNSASRWTYVHPKPHGHADRHDRHKHPHGGRDRARKAERRDDDGRHEHRRERKGQWDQADRGERPRSGSAGSSSRLYPRLRTHQG